MFSQKVEDRLGDLDESRGGGGGFPLLDTNQEGLTQASGSLQEGVFVPQKTQARLGDVAGSVPDHCSKANTAIKQVQGLCWFPRAWKFRAHDAGSVSCAIALCLKRQRTWLH